MTEDPIRVLLIEDNPADAAHIEQLLANAPWAQFRLESKDRVHLALQRLASGDVDVILLDLSLPDTQGETLDAMDRIHRFVPEVPIVVLTGLEDDELALRAVREGAQDYLVKRELQSGLLVRAIRYAIERSRADRAQRESEERYALAVQGANDGLWDWDLKSDRIYFSPRWKSMLGCQDDEVSDRPQEWFQRIHADDRALVQTEVDAHLEGLTAHFKIEHRMRHRSGEYRWVLNRGLAVRDAAGKAYRMAGSQSDITDRKLAEERLLHDAFHDALTGLPNRALFIDRLGLSIAQSKRYAGYLFAVLFLDLDRFKNINDSLGHSIGDQVLVAIAQRLQALLRPGDTVARLGGDEFAILLDRVDEVQHATRVAGRVQRELALPFHLNGHEVYTSASIGITLSASGYDRPEDVLRDADIAMYRAKSMGRARHEVFDRDMHMRAVELLQLETDLRRAVERKEFRIYYQPIVDLDSGRINGFEALVRWEHPRSGLVAPRSFIHVAEDTGLIIPIGWWVLEEACAQMATWQERFPAAGPLSISVNLSVKQFMQPDLIEGLRQILERTELKPGSLQLEITEGAIMEHAESAVLKLLQIRALGIQLHIDDFGTGYSSLSYLHRLPTDTVKIDQSFISRLGGTEDKSVIVGTIVAMARRLGMSVAAEGLETEEQLAQLRSLECHYGQGYLFSKPLEGSAAGILLAAAPQW